MGLSLQQNLIPSNNEDAMNPSYIAFNMVLPTTSSRTVPSMSVPSATLWPQDTSLSTVTPNLALSPDTTTLVTLEAPLMSMSEVIPQMYNGDNVTDAFI